MEDRREIGRALAREDLVIHYQPIVDPHDGTAVSAEALLRGRDDDRRYLNIAELTAMAERTEEIFELDRWSIEQTFRDAATWQQHGLPELALNLNLSAREFQNPDLLPTMDKLARAEGIDPGRINLEITETSSIHDPARAESVLMKLQERGYHLWLDDFGTGHSSLEWLKWFQVEGLKIPRPFVGDLLTDERSEAIVRAVCGLAEDLDCLLVAEGVENREQLSRLLEFGIKLVQGYLFYEALPPAELERTLLNAESKPPRAPGRPSPRRSSSAKPRPGRRSGAVHRGR